jgi:hypothetical protein
MEDRLKKIQELLKSIRSDADRILELGEDLPCTVRNAKRLIATVRMLELEISDALNV